MDIAQFDFTLPEALIARHPIRPRTHARLLHVKNEGALKDYHIYDLEHLLRAGDGLVINDCKVIPARLTSEDGAITATFLEPYTPSNPNETKWRIFAKPARKLKKRQSVMLHGGLNLHMVEEEEAGSLIVETGLTVEEFYRFLEGHGAMPLPPYIEKARQNHKEAVVTNEDHTHYQTVYAKHSGAVAAPTAGLHFDEALLNRLKAMGVQIIPVTLMVGAGTFLPVKVNQIDDHIMHKEWGNISQESAAQINHIRNQGGRIVALGTTSLRILEAVAALNPIGTPLQAFDGATDIFIRPGYQFKLADCLITNFHLPKSTLFMLVCAFNGLATMQKAYAHAIHSGYRFFSYGDACFLERHSVI